MRIRKHASKVLGSVAVLRSYSPPAAARIWSQSLPWLLEGSGAAGPTCELNRSPWDVTPSPPRQLPDQLPTISHQAVGKEGEDGGVMVNGIEVQEEPIRSSVTASISALSILNKEVQEEVERGRNMEERKEKRDAKKRRMRKAVDTVVVAICKKTDGKKWKCRRPAQSPHTLCHYHLSQVRAYSCNQNHKTPAAKSQPRNPRNRVAEGAAATAEPGSNYYYYYFGFGPWQRKRRGGVVDGGEGEVGGEQEKKEEEITNASDSENGYDPPTFRKDARKSEDEAMDDEEGCRDADGGNDNVEEHSDSSKHGRDERRSHSSKGRKARKRVKARSLKSLF